MPNELLDDRSVHMKALRRQFVERIKTDADAVAPLVNSVDDTGILALRSLCHAIRGSAPMFGLSAMADAAVTLHRKVKDSPGDRAPILASWNALYVQIQQSAQG
jgi:HPt (histidine-containing phosphotransfer) domain-containing protein